MCLERKRRPPKDGPLHPQLIKERIQTAEVGDPAGVSSPSAKSADAEGSFTLPLAARGSPRIIKAPVTQTAPPITESIATCSPRKMTPNTSASAGIRNAAEEARVAPKRPAEIDMMAKATPVLSTPSASRAASGQAPIGYGKHRVTRMARQKQAQPIGLV